jgi:hypothetical protein
MAGGSAWRAEGASTKGPAVESAGPVIIAVGGGCIPNWEEASRPASLITGAEEGSYGLGHPQPTRPRRIKICANFKDLTENWPIFVRIGTNRDGIRPVVAVARAK